MPVRQHSSEQVLKIAAQSLPPHSSIGHCEFVALNQCYQAATVSSVGWQLSVRESMPVCVQVSNNTVHEVRANVRQGHLSRIYLTSSCTELLVSMRTIRESTELEIKLTANVVWVEARKQTARRQLQKRTKDGSR